MKNTCEAYKGLCTEFYDLDKPHAPQDARDYYLKQASQAKGPILEPMCGTGRFLIPLLEKGYDVTGFDTSDQMLEVCKTKCGEKNLKATLVKSSFEDFHAQGNFDLIFIPAGSFCLLADPVQAKRALEAISNLLAVEGKFIVEIDTVKAAANEKSGIWTSRSVVRPDGSLVVGSFASSYNEKSRIETTLCRYESWENNAIVNTEVEDFRIRLYEAEEMKKALSQIGFKILRISVPYTGAAPDHNSTAILYECKKT